MPVGLAICNGTVVRLNVLLHRQLERMLQDPTRPGDVPLLEHLGHPGSRKLLIALDEPDQERYRRVSPQDALRLWHVSLHMHLLTQGSDVEGMCCQSKSG
jgi:hypothetical protein